MYHIKDEEFLRGKVPMTKEEIRFVSIGKMELQDDDICLDIGGGTGSVSMEMARFARNGKVFVIERNDEAIELIYKNVEKFDLKNVTVIKGMANVFLKEFLKKFPVENYPDKDEFYQKLIMASILEREAAVESEKPLMASVFYNRIAKNMTLSADSTVNFVFNYEKKRIYYKDLEVDSPYNTYKNKGLPPGPICNPTVSSVNAAYNPADTEYLFFVTKGGGEHFFSKTYKEHLDFQKNK